jgi:hypothetical protein
MPANHPQPAGPADTGPDPRRSHLPAGLLLANINE